MSIAYLWSSFQDSLLRLMEETPAADVPAPTAPAMSTDDNENKNPPQKKEIPPKDDADPLRTTQQPFTPPATTWTSTELAYASGMANDFAQWFEGQGWITSDQFKEQSTQEHLKRFLDVDLELYREANKIGTQHEWLMDEDTNIEEARAIQILKVREALDEDPVMNEEMFNKLKEVTKNETQKVGEEDVSTRKLLHQLMALHLISIAEGTFYFPYAKMMYDFEKANGFTLESLRTQEDYDKALEYGHICRTRTKFAEAVSAMLYVDPVMEHLPFEQLLASFKGEGESWKKTHHEKIRQFQNQFARDWHNIQPVDCVVKDNLTREELDKLSAVGWNVDMSLYHPFSGRTWVGDLDRDKITLKNLLYDDISSPQRTYARNGYTLDLYKKLLAKQGLDRKQKAMDEENERLRKAMIKDTAMRIGSTSRGDPLPDTGRGSPDGRTPGYKAFHKNLGSRAGEGCLQPGAYKTIASQEKQELAIKRAQEVVNEHRRKQQPPEPAPAGPTIETSKWSALMQPGPSGSSASQSAEPPKAKPQVKAPQLEDITPAPKETQKKEAVRDPPVKPAPQVPPLTLTDPSSSTLIKQSDVDFAGRQPIAQSEVGSPNDPTPRLSLRDESWNHVGHWQQTHEHTWRFGIVGDKAAVDLEKLHDKLVNIYGSDGSEYQTVEGPSTDRDRILRFRRIRIYLRSWNDQDKCHMQTVITMQKKWQNEENMAWTKENLPVIMREIEEVLWPEYNPSVPVDWNPWACYRPKRKEDVSLAEAAARVEREQQASATPAAVAGQTATRPAGPNDYFVGGIVENHVHHTGKWYKDQWGNDKEYVDNGLCFHLKEIGRRPNFKVTKKSYPQDRDKHKLPTFGFYVDLRQPLEILEIIHVQEMDCDAVQKGQPEDHSRLWNWTFARVRPQEWNKKVTNTSSINHGYTMQESIEWFCADPKGPIKTPMEVDSLTIGLCRESNYPKEHELYSFETLCAMVEGQLISEEHPATCGSAAVEEPGKSSVVPTAAKSASPAKPPVHPTEPPPQHVVDQHAQVKREQEEDALADLIYNTETKENSVMMTIMTMLKCMMRDLKKWRLMTTVRNVLLGRTLQCQQMPKLAHARRVEVLLIT